MISQPDGTFVSRGGLPTRITRPEPSPLSRAVSLQAQTASEVASLRTEIVALQQGLHMVERTLDTMRQNAVAGQLTTPLSQTREVVARLAQVSSLLGEQERALREAAQTIETLRNERGQLQSLCVIAEHINSTLDRPELLKRILDDLLTLVHADRGAILLNDIHQQLQLEVARQASHISPGRDMNPISRGTIEQVWRTQEPLLASNAQTDSRINQHPSVRVQAIHAIMCAPLWVQEHAIGVVYVDQVSPGARPFDLEALDLLSAFCNEAAIAIENANLFAAQKLQTQEIAAIKTYTESILASITSGVLAIDNDGRVTRANNAMQTLLGVTPERIIGRPFEEVLVAIADSTPIAHIRATIDQPEVKESLTIKTQLSDHEGDFDLKIAWSALLDTNHHRLGTVIVLDDLTVQEQHKHEADVLRMYVDRDIAKFVTTNPNATRLGGQDREISVVFADIRGYTALGEGMSPTELGNLLNEYLAMLAKAVHQNGGTVTMFQGDAIMAIFNAPQDQPDHALRAVRTAWSMRKAILEYNQRTGINNPVNFGIGVNTGPAMVGNIGAEGLLHNYTAIGDTVNSAKRIQEGAIQNQIFLSDDTYRLVSSAIHAKRAKDLDAKGKAKPIPVWELTGLN